MRSASASALLLMAACAHPRVELPPAPARPQMQRLAFTPQASEVSLSRRPQVLELRAFEASSGLLVFRVPHPSAMVTAILAAPRTDPMDLRQSHVVEMGIRQLEDRRPKPTAFDGGADASRVWLSLYALPEAFETGLARLALVASGALPSSSGTGAGIERLHLEAMQSLDRSHRGADFLTSVVLRRSLYGERHPWAQDLRQQVAALSDMTWQKYYLSMANVFSAQASVLVLVGPADALPSNETVQELFSRLRKGAVAPPKLVPAPKPRTMGGQQIHAFWDDTEQTFVRILHVVPASPNPKTTAALKVLREMLSGLNSEASRTFRHQRGATYHLGANLYDRGTVWELKFGGWVGYDQAPSVVSHHVEWLKRARSGDVSQDDFRIALQRIRARAIRSRTNSPWLAWKVAKEGTRLKLACMRASDLCRGGSILRIDDDPVLRTVEPSDVVALVREYIDPDRLEVGVYGVEDPEWANHGDLSVYRTGR